MPNAKPSSQTLFQLGDLRAKDVLAVVEHGMDAGVDRAFQLAVLRLEVDKWEVCLRRFTHTSFSHRARETGPD